MLPTIFIIGKSGAGKDFYCKRVQEDKKVIPVIQYTTRPLRDDEINGKDVNCVSREEFQKLIDENKVFEHRQYNVNVAGVPDVWFYGTPSLTEDKNGIYVFAATVDIIKSACEAYPNHDLMEVIYIDTSDEVREYRASHIRKSFDKTEWDRRVLADAKDFSKERLDSIEALLGKKIHFFDNNDDNAKDKFHDFYAEIAGKLISKYNERKNA